MTEKKKKMYGLQTLGRVRVFRKDKQITGKNKKTYDITDVWFNVSEKEEDGTYFNKSMNLLFKRGLDLPENNTTIELSAFPVITGNGDYRKIALMVTDWEYSDADKKTLDLGNDPFARTMGQPINISDDDLPF